MTRTPEITADTANRSVTVVSVCRNLTRAERLRTLVARSVGYDIEFREAETLSAADSGEAALVIVVGPSPPPARRPSALSTPVLYLIEGPVPVEPSLLGIRSGYLDAIPFEAFDGASLEWAIQLARFERAVGTLGAASVLLDLFSLPAGLLDLRESAEPNLLVMNHAWLTVSGRRAETLRGSGWLDQFDTGTRRTLADDWVELRRTGKPVARELSFRTVGGDAATLVFTALPGIAPCPDTVLCVAHPSTGGMLSHSLQLAVRGQERLATVGTLAAGVGHDLNNTLAIVNGNLELMKRTSPDKEQFKKLLGNAATGSDRARTLLKRLLAFAKPQRLEPSEVDVAELAGETLELLRPTLGRHITASLVAAPEPARLTCRVTDIQQVLINLLLNGRDAMPKGGALTVRILYRLTLDREDGSQLYSGFEVEDSGIGMTDEVRARIFDRFYSTKNGSGSGLGLSSAQRLVLEHNGKISCTSAPGKGTSFYVLLPVDDTVTARN